MEGKGCTHILFDLGQIRDHIRLTLFDMLRKGLWPQIRLIEFLAELGHLLGIYSKRKVCQQGKLVGTSVLEDLLQTVVIEATQFLAQVLRNWHGDGVNAESPL